MKIGIIGAMEKEISSLRDQLHYPILYEQAKCKIYTGKLYDAEVVLVQSGIGKVHAALGTMLLLDHFKPNLVINTGSAGSMIPSLNIGDIVVPKKVGYHDVDITAFGYEFGQLAQCPTLFNASSSLISLVKEISDDISINIHYGVVVSGDTFIKGAKSLDRINRLFPQAIAVEMEAAAIAHTCYQFNVPFIIVRAISDLINQISDLSFKEFLTVAAQNSSYLIQKLVQALTK